MCEYCENEKSISFFQNDAEMTICEIEESDGSFTWGIDADGHQSIEINYCPMCGRKLKEENK